MIPTIAVTMGDPAGIGPEIVLKALSDSAVRDAAQWIIAGDRSILQLAAPRLLEQIEASGRVNIQGPQMLDHSRFQFGKLDAACGKAGVEYVRIATQLCLDRQADAMVTAPLNKEAVALSGIPFSGHTEYIAALCGGSDSRMLLVSDRLRVAHVTTHVPLRKACDVDPARILHTIELATAAVKRMGCPDPRVAVCGLNPHAGEHGLFGVEDDARIAPAVKQAVEAGIRCDGPLPADTVFLKAVRGAYDLVIAMYHDQGHIPIKLLDFERTVNVSIGIPILRTSVDHGTAFDIAGRGIADPENMKAAMRLACRMA